MIAELTVDQVVGDELAELHGQGGGLAVLANLAATQGNADFSSGGKQFELLLNEGCDGVITRSSNAIFVRRSNSVDRTCESGALGWIAQVVAGSIEGSVRGLLVAFKIVG